jgi:23S rRNA (uracil1939-C5)-methyltransferase
VFSASAARVVPRCRHFGTCGGCSLQHLDAAAQVAAKQRLLEDSLWHIGNVRPETVLPPIYGATWHYRHRARFSARFVVQKGGALLGFREKRSSYVADMTECEIVPPRVSALLLPLRELISGLSIREAIPQIELAIGEDVDALVLRHLLPFSTLDEDRLRKFAVRYDVRFFVQPEGPESARPLDPYVNALLCYRLPEFGLKIDFAPTDFTQVNHATNAMLVRRAIALLDPRPRERIADMFCGLGNFSLAIARRGAYVLGVEGSARLIAAASANAVTNGLEKMTDFVRADLFKMDACEFQRLGKFDRMLIDPPRTGAIELVKSLGDAAPGRVVYVSCNLATLARDAAALVHNNYILSAAGVVNMFPHTSHVESIAVFDRK